VFLEFLKYQATGNDFIIVDYRSNNLHHLNTNRIKSLCDRNLGIGSDGFIEIYESNNFDFRMIYYNSDGKKSSLCGNGTRCVVKYIGNILKKEKVTFEASDGIHVGYLNENNEISIEMSDVKDFKIFHNYMLFETGSPHYVEVVDDIHQINVCEEGSKIRNSEKFKKNGINVNFVQRISDSEFFVRTYERGVENETKSCGTGSIASALAMFESKKTIQKNIKILTKGGYLFVAFEKVKNVYKKIKLTGSAFKVFEGKIEI
tara:strand:- start:294 stop:1073 length:780 start_codon:yes stop_codon:yes gene_type:complete